MTTTAPQPTRIVVDQNEMLQSIFQMIQRMDGQLNNISIKLDKVVVASSTAAAAKPRESKPRPPRAPKFPDTAKVWFKKIYTESEAERAKYATMAKGASATQKWVKATAEERPRIEADHIFKTLSESAQPEDIAKLDAIKKGFETAREQKKASLGVVAAATPASTSTPVVATAAPVAIPAPVVAAAPKKARAPSKKGAAAAAKKPVNAIPPPEDDASDDGEPDA